MSASGGGDGATTTHKDAGLEMVMLVDSIGQLSSAAPADSPSEREAQFLALRAKVAELLAAQKGIPNRHAAVGQTDTAPLMSWLQTEHKVDTSKVQIARFGNAGNGLEATTDLKKGDTFLTIPESAMMTTETAKASSLGTFLVSDPLVAQMPNVALALHVLAELGRGSSSKWAPYIQALPRDYSTPLYFTDRDFELLRGSTAWTPAVSLYQSIVRQYAYIYKQLHKSVDVRKQLGYGKPSLFTFGDYKWAVSAVMTRQNRIPLGGTAYEPEFGLAMIPLWDMINHADGVVTSEHDIVTKVTECTAMRDYANGQQIFMFYGPRTNLELLLHSGFVMPDNRHDYTTIKLGVGKADPLRALKVKLLDLLTVPSSGDFVVGCDGELDPQLNAFIRVNAMTEEELTHHLGNPQACATLGNADGAVNESNEQKACMFLETRFKLLLMAYRSSLQDDDALLAQPDLPFTTRCVVQLRRGEKKTLAAAAAKVAERALEEEL
eukprot:m.48480 g.48480  ORF g.48480 m.48480 type:complete len:493 (+) comp6997_c0_seq2:221-1699(+)